MILEMGSAVRGGERMEPALCPYCRKRLFDVASGSTASSGSAGALVEVKCPRCKRISRLPGGRK